ncbi:MAG: hypothetical protein ACI93T_003481, partial [Porticoccaceae bacterium]
MALLKSRRGGRVLLPEFLAMLVLSSYFGAAVVAEGSELNLRFRTRAEVSPESGQYREVTKPATWNAKETAIVICDMWNDHYCRNAA